jgi:hypothetical protein
MRGSTHNVSSCVRCVAGTSPAHEGDAAMKSRAERQIEATDRRIDALVYELYDLTEDEIQIVEEAVG